MLLPVQPITNSRSSNTLYFWPTVSRSISDVAQRRSRLGQIPIAAVSIPTLQTWRQYGSILMSSASYSTPSFLRDSADSIWLLLPSIACRSGNLHRVSARTFGAFAPFLFQPFGDTVVNWRGDRHPQGA